MTQLFLKLALLFVTSGAYVGVQAQYKPQDIPEATLEGTLRATENLQKRGDPPPQARKIVDNPLVEMMIALEVVQQHQECFLRAEAFKAKKKELYDSEWTDDQRTKVEVISSPSYRQELLRSPEFGGIKLGIASSLPTSNPKVLSKAVELLQDDVGLDFVLAWLQPALREHIDKSCGNNPIEAEIDGWKGMLLWERLARRFGLSWKTGSDTDSPLRQR